jgi:hypothetical protein
MRGILPIFTKSGPGEAALLECSLDAASCSVSQLPEGFPSPKTAPRSVTIPHNPLANCGALHLTQRYGLTGQEPDVLEHQEPNERQGTSEQRDDYGRTRYQDQE